MHMLMLYTWCVSTEEDIFNRYHISPCGSYCGSMVDVQQTSDWMAHTGFDVFVVYCIGCLELVQNIVEGNLSSVSYTIYSMYPSIMNITWQTAFD